ncbi:hypothetical protein AAEX28_00325 [Lentisphaerota bacterium WC36G]|nr:hypothetical protein LJT99_03205 [Lentisphaerae bacterium WC36]
MNKFIINRKNIKIFTLAILCLTSFFYASNSEARKSRSSSRLKSRITCSTCHKNIYSGEKYFKSNGKTYCSKNCYNASLPTCTICSKKMNKWLEAKGKKYCSEQCLSKTLPQCKLCKKHVKSGFRINDWQHGSLFYCKSCAQKNKCFSCQLPGVEYKLADGRLICERCDKTAVHDKKEIKKYLVEVRKVMKEKLNIPTHDKVKIYSVDINTMHELSKKNNQISNGEDILELGLYSVKKTYKDTTYRKFSLTKGFYEETVSTLTHESYDIYVLYGTPRKKLIEVIAHELAHDYFYQHFPNINNLKIKEGFAEYVASLVNIKYKNSKSNLRMEENTDPIYGGGYRMIKKIAKKHGGLPGLLKFLAKENEAQKK